MTAVTTTSASAERRSCGGHGRLLFVRHAAHGLSASLVLTFLGLTIVTFCIGRVMPIDPVLAIVGDRAPPEVYARVRARARPRQPLYQQFWLYLPKLLHGDFGTSVLTSQPVLDDLMRFFPATFELATIATSSACSRRARRACSRPSQQGRWPDHLIRVARPVRLFGAGVLARPRRPASSSTASSTGSRARAARCLLRGHRRRRVTGIILIDAASPANGTSSATPSAI